MRVKSCYTRTIADRLWAGVPVHVHLRVRKFFCHNPHCGRTVFAERGPTLAATSTRRTLRRVDDQRQMRLAHGDAGEACTGARLGRPASSDTVLRLVRRAEMARPAPHGCWAFRSGAMWGDQNC